MTAPPWSLRELRPQEWWAVAEGTGTAYSLDDNVAIRLWARHDLLAVPLEVALRAASSEVAHHQFVDLRFVGVTARYVSDDPEVIGCVEAIYAGGRSNLRNSPGVIVELTAEADLDRLHRSVDGLRAGVHLRVPHEEHAQPGASTLPVVPPLQLPPFAGRFCSLHAALLATSNGNVVVCGRQRSGKTTAAALVGRLGVAMVLTDELVLVDPSGDACGVALPVRERAAARRVSYPLDPTDDGARLVAVDRIVVLAAASGEPSTRRIRELPEALRLIAPHLRPLAGRLGVATGNMLEMLRRAEVWLWRLRPWPDLRRDVAAAVDELLQGRAL